MKKISQVLAALLVAVGSAAATAQSNSANGQVIWANQCLGCHQDNSTRSLTIIRGYISSQAPVVGLSEPKALAALNAALAGRSLPPRSVATGMDVGLLLTNAEKNDVSAFIAGLQALAPQVSYAPTSGPQFPATAVGSSSSQTVTISNSGTAPLVFAVNNAVTIATGGDAADFRVTSSSCPAMTLQPGVGSCSINVSFQPLAGAATTRTASVGLTHNASGGSSLVPMLGIVAGASGGGTPPPTGSANPPSSGGGGAEGWHGIALLLLLALTPLRRSPMLQRTAQLRRTTRLR